MQKQNNPLYLGIDIGGSAVKYGWAESDLKLLHYGRINLQGNSVNSIRTAINEALKITDEKVGLSNIAGIGVGTPGTINRKTNRLVGVNPNLPDWVDLDPSCLFQDEFKHKLYFDNDANLMALAESRLSQGSSHVIGITIGSGIGCGLIADGKIYHGANGYAMELGHNIVIPNGELCNCGKKGCLEAYASVNGLLNYIRKSQPEVVLSNMIDILKYAELDALTSNAIKRSISLMATAIANLAINLDADLIVLGGGVAELPGYPLDDLKEKILDGLSELIKDKIVIKMAEEGNKAGVIGGICLAVF